MSNKTVHNENRSRNTRAAIDATYTLLAGSAVVAIISCTTILAILFGWPAAAFIIIMIVAALAAATTVILDNLRADLRDLNNEER